MIALCPVLEFSPASSKAATPGSVMKSAGCTMKYKVAVIIISDRCAHGERQDECLPEFQRSLASGRFEFSHSRIVSDEIPAISHAVQEAIDSGCHLIFSSGGTGCAPRDVTPEAVRPMLDKLTPGIDEAIRAFSLTRNQNTIFSRGISGIAKQSFVICLPGSPKAVAEILSFLVPMLEHPLALLTNQIADCHRPEVSGD